MFGPLPTKGVACAAKTKGALRSHTRRLKMGNSTERIVSPTGTFSFPALFVADENDKYGVKVVFAPGEDLTALETIVDQAVAAEFGSNVPADMNAPIKDVTSESDLKYFPEGSRFIRATSKFQPNVVDEKAQPVMDQDLIYSGVLGRVQISARAYDFKGKKGVKFDLAGAQRAGSGTRIGGGGSAFTALSVDDIL